MPLINPSNMLAIIIGVKNYNDLDLPALPAAKRNAQELENIMLDTAIVGIPEEQVLCVTDDLALTDQNRLRRAIDDFIKVNVGKFNIQLILFYFAGHGDFDENKNYYLCIKDTEKQNKKFTAMDIKVLRDNLLVYKKKLIMILDSCFSENAVNEIESNGTDYYIMASSAYNRVTQYPIDKLFAAFTGLLIEVLRKGIVRYADNQFLNFVKIFEEIKTRLATANMPEPKCTDKNECGKIDFALNNSYGTEEEIFTINKRFFSNALSDFDPTMKEETNETIGILNRYPLFISRYLKDLIAKDSKKLTDKKFFILFYHQIIKFLTFISIKNIKDRAVLTQRDRIIIGNIFKNKPSIKLHYTILKIASVKTEAILLKEFTGEAEFLQTITSIQDAVRKIEIKHKGDNIIQAIELVEFNFLRRKVLKLAKNLAFFCNYNINAVRFIKVEKGYFGAPKYYHEISRLYGPQANKYDFDPNLPLMHNAAVIIYPKTATLASQGDYLDLWPFIIDANGSDDSEMPAIQFYSQNKLEFIKALKTNVYYYESATFKNTSEKIVELFGDITAYKELLKLPSTEDCDKFFAEYQ